jgi:hypothetical protein
MYRPGKTGGGNMREAVCEGGNDDSDTTPASPLEDFVSSLSISPIAPVAGTLFGFMMDAYRGEFYGQFPEHPFICTYIFGGIGVGISALFCGTALTLYIKDKIERKEWISDYEVDYFKGIIGKE